MGLFGMFESKGSIAINVDPAVFSGARVTGRVYLHVKQPIDASSLQLVVFGEEYSHVRYETGSGDNKQTHHAYARRNLLYIVVDLASFPGGKAAPGNYEFPFSAVLPAGLPTTMFARGDGGDCKVHYGMKARLHRPGFFSWDIKAQRSIAVSGMPMPPEPTPVFSPPTTTQVNFCCCFNRGQMTMGAYSSDTTLHRGEAFSLAVALKNESSAEVQQLSVELVEHVRWTARGRSNDARRVVAHATFAPSQIEGTDKLDAEGLKAAAENPGRAGHVMTEVYNKLVSATQSANLVTSADMRDTYTGSTVFCSHTLFVTCSTPLCITNPVVEISCRVGPPAFVAQAQAMPIVATAIALPMAPPPQAVPVMTWLPEAMPLDKTEQETVAFAQALPAGWEGSVVVAEAVEVPMGTAVVGGVGADGGEDLDEQYLMAVPVVQLAAPGTLPCLKGTMDTAFDDLRALLGLLEGPDREAWLGLFGTMAPVQLGWVVGQVNMEATQPAVARLLAQQLSGGLTGAHVVQVLQQCSQNYKANVLNMLAPLVVDLEGTRPAIENQLSDWEKILCAKALEGGVRA